MGPSSSARTPSVSLKQAIADIRPAFVDLGDSMQAFAATRREMAPKFMALYARWRRETGRPFVAFVHAIDPTVPAGDKRQYMRHRSYMVARYLQRLVAAPETRAGAVRRASLSPLRLLAVALKTLIPLAHPYERETYQAVVHAGRWHERDQQRLRRLVDRTKPLAIPLPGVPRLRKRQLELRVSNFTSGRLEAADRAR